MKKLFLLVLAIMLTSAAMSDTMDNRSEMFGKKNIFSKVGLDMDMKSLKSLAAKLNNRKKSDGISMLAKDIKLDSSVNVHLYFDTGSLEDKTEYIYNNDLLLSKALYYYADEESSDGLILEEVVEFEYNSKGLFAKMIMLEPINEEGDMQMRGYYNFQYNTNDKMYHIDVYSLYEGVMEHVATFEWDYNENGDITEERQYNLNEDMSLILYFLSEYFYDQNGFLERIDSYEYDWEYEELIHNEQTQVECDESGNIIMTTTFNWYEDEWDIDEQIKYSEDENGNPIREEYYIFWDGEITFSYVYEYTYDLNVIYSDIAAPNYMFLEPNHSNKIVNKPLDTFFYPTSENEDEYYLTTYYYSDTETSVMNSDNNISMTIYPNPTKDYINIESGSDLIRGIAINDLAGRNISNVNDINSFTYKMDVSRLSVGTYIIRTEYNNHSVSKVFIKE